MAGGDCDPKGKCPGCGYMNGPGAQRCVRCRAVLVVMQGCSGACSKCIVAPLNPDAKSN